MDVTEYLIRIRCLDFKQVSLDNLRQLQKRHTQTIPFENLDIQLGRHINFSIDEAYNKIVRSFRGGYCLELNPLFGWLLTQLGYEMYFIACYPYNQYTAEYSKHLFHIAIIVRIDGEDYYVDVGIPRPLRYPLKLSMNQTQSDLFGNFRFIRDHKDHNMIVLERAKRNRFGDEWKPIIKFENKARDLDFFNEMNELVQTPANPFIYLKSICSRHTEKSMLVLVDAKFSEIKFEDKREIRKETVLTNEETFRVLRKHFGIIVTDVII